MQTTGAEESVFEPPPKKRLYSSIFKPSSSPLSQSNMSRHPPSQTASPGSTQSYPSLFQVSAEFPRFMASYRWWEDEATTVLWAFNIPEISQVIRYGLFQDENFPRNSLLSRNSDTIDAFLFALSDPHEHQLLASLSHFQRVEEILRRSRVPPFQPIPWSWFPPPPGHALDACTIATAIDAESHVHFRRIAFEELVRTSLGYHDASVEWFLLQHTTFYIHLLDHLLNYPEETTLYIEVEKHLRSRSQFAHRALVQCVHNIQPEAIRTMPLPTTPGFDFIAGPIQSLFKEHPPSLTHILKVFSVLAVRFRREYIHTSKMEWKIPFDTTLLFLDDCLASTSAMDLAKTMTVIDEVDFSHLSRQSLVTQDTAVKHLLTSWHTLSISVWECCSALPDMIPYLRECAQSLYERRNYHSLTAILHGLHRYATTTARSRGLNSAVGGMVVLEPLLPPHAVFLTNPTHNYTGYRKQYLEAPGIPFLTPHLRDHQQHGETALQPLLQYLQTSFSAKGAEPGEENSIANLPGQRVASAATG
ncbi:Guanine-nucleotide dissociation stimulator CDC25 [Penicillium hispanicum]|uniref:Guanine-nucleotide dissociation stimulator CDC25 n=1 Tax=Penicillium hispanicum TaxID=1080232 RepID=UPI0025410A73|nr:Guanine-nucleotide dissociation stimulator CDC25 [Penicillium hispanicum]KAJ5594305.1 Guanine-nucleotide dissociation stimulator CDC25 [Penicillium hispanicum]